MKEEEITLKKVVKQQINMKFTYLKMFFCVKLKLRAWVMLCCVFAIPTLWFGYFCIWSIQYNASFIATWVNINTVLLSAITNLCCYYLVKISKKTALILLIEIVKLLSLIISLTSYVDILCYAMIRKRPGTRNTTLN